MRRIEKYFMLSLVIVFISAMIVPAASAQDAFRGVWVSIDNDGSSQRLVIGRGPGDSHFVSYFDRGATVCGLDPETGAILYAASAFGRLSTSETELAGTMPVICWSRPPSFYGTFYFDFIYDASSDTLTDSTGVVWHRR
jgi:hypothetical protein